MLFSIIGYGADLGRSRLVVFGQLVEQMLQWSLLNCLWKVAFAFFIQNFGRFLDSKQLKTQAITKVAKHGRYDSHVLMAIDRGMSQLKNMWMCHSPLSDWIADAGELDMDVDTVVRQNLRKGISATNLNFNPNFKINCD